MATKQKKAKAPVAKAGPQPRADINGWVLCPGDNVLVVSPGEEYHGLFGKVDAFPTTLELSSYVQIDGRPSTSGRVLLPNAQLRWMGPDEEHIEKHRPTRPGQQVRVVLENDSLSTPEMKSLEGKLGTVTEFGPINGTSVHGSFSMVTVKFDDPELAQWPTNINSFDLLVVPTPVVQYVPEPEAEHPAIQEESDLPFLNEQAQPEEEKFDPYKLPHFTEVRAEQDREAEAHKEGLRMVHIGSIFVTSNTRKVFDETALAELAESIKAHGILQPIVVRPAGLKFELVAGGRRYRAAQLAGLERLPATVRNLTDREFLEVQLLENLQRVDVRPADEAQAFAKLLKSDFSAEEVALKVGKPVKFVLQRAKLVALIPFWFEALEQGRLLLVSANELARLPAHSQLVVKQSYREDDYPNGWPAVEIRSKIESRVTRNLEKAPWDKADATLVPAAGPCITCPKRSTAQALLFEQEGPALCLDGTCFAGKEVALAMRRLAEVTQELGEKPKQVSSNWSLTPEQKAAGVISYEHFSWVEANHTQAVPVLVMDGEHTGQIKHVNFYNSSRGQTGTKEDNKAQRDAAILSNRIGRAKNDMWAGMLRDMMLNQLAGGGDGARCLVDSFLRDVLTWGRSRTTNDTLAYLHEQYGWTKATEADLEANWPTGKTHEQSKHRQYLNREMARMTLLDKLVLYFDLKFIRDGLDNNEISNRQQALVKLLPTSYQDEFEITAKVEKLVQERYYSKGKKKEVAA